MIQNSGAFYIFMVIIMYLDKEWALELDERDQVSQPLSRLEPHGAVHSAGFGRRLLF